MIERRAFLKGMVGVVVIPYVGIGMPIPDLNVGKIVGEEIGKQLFLKEIVFNSSEPNLILDDMKIAG